MWKIALIASLWSGVALAEPAPAKINFKDLPPASEIVGMSPGNYYRVLIGEEYGRVEELVVDIRKRAGDGDPADSAGSYDNLHTRLVESRKRLVGFPAYKDEDAALRDAVLAAYNTWTELAAAERDKASPLAARIPTSDGDMREWEKARLDLDKKWSASNTKVREVVDGFADKHRLVFVVEDDNKKTRAPFQAEGLPKGNSELADALWVAAAVRYHNALYAHAGTMVGAMNAAADKMNTTELEPARVESLKAVKEALADAKKFGAFGGTSALRDSVVTYGDWMVGQLEGPLKTHAELTKEGKVTREVADQLDVISDELNAGAQERAATLQTERAKFMSTWHVESFVSWQDAR